MRKAFIANCVIPMIYMGLLVLLRFNYLSMKTQDLIYGNGIFFWVGQLIAVIIGFVFCKKAIVRIFLVLAWFCFFLLEYKTIKLFNGFSA
jgi:hypothetical protein